MATKTSFQKKSRVKGFQIPGTRPSLHNNQLLISTGIPSLDNVLGNVPIFKRKSKEPFILTNAWVS